MCMRKRAFEIPENISATSQEIKHNESHKVTVFFSAFVSFGFCLFFLNRAVVVDVFRRIKCQIETNVLGLSVCFVFVCHITLSLSRPLFLFFFGFNFYFLGRQLNAKYRAKQKSNSRNKSNKRTASTAKSRQKERGQMKRKKVKASKNRKKKLPEKRNEVTIQIRN